MEWKPMPRDKILALGHKKGAHGGMEASKGGYEGSAVISFAAVAATSTVVANPFIDTLDTKIRSKRCLR